MPLTVADWTRWRGPRHIDPYLSAAVSSQIVRIVTEDSPPRKVLAVTDPDPIGP